MAGALTGQVPSLLRRAAAALSLTQGSRTLRLVLLPGRAPLPARPAGVAGTLVGTLGEMARGLLGHDVALATGSVGGRCAASREGGPPVALAELPDRAVLLVANASYVLRHAPQRKALVSEAFRGAVAVAADLGREELLAFALRLSPGTRPLLAPLVAGLLEGSGGAPLPGAWRTLPGLVPFDVLGRPAAAPPSSRSRPSEAAPRFVNAAFEELLAGTGGGGERAAELVALGGRSRVPWVFNLWANEVERAALSPVVSAHPVECHLCVTGLCNLECRFCSFRPRTALPGRVALREVEGLEWIRHLSAIRLSSGNGEPTLNGELPAIVGHLSRRFPALRIGFFTNGVRLGTPPLLEALTGAVETVHVSLNAARRETWAALTGADRFDEVVTGIDALRREKERRHAHHPVLHASMVVNRLNVREAPLLPALCRRLGIDRLTLIPFFALGYDGLGKLGRSDTLGACRQEYDRLLPGVVREAERAAVSVELPEGGGEERIVNGLSARVLHDFAGLGGTDPEPLASFVRRALPAPAGAPGCPTLWTTALLGKTDRTHAAGSADRHFLYPCLGPLATVDFSARHGFRLGDLGDLLPLFNSPDMVRLRRAQAAPGTSRVCDLCRGADSRDPRTFAAFEAALLEWRA